MMNGVSGHEKPLYCHWDTHDHDVLFMNEVELDQHLYSHFQQRSAQEQGIVPQSTYIEPKPHQNVECHWDACHEMFDIDEIMDHFRTSHQEHSLRPHHGNCVHNENESSDSQSTMETSNSNRQLIPDAYVRMNRMVPSQTKSTSTPSRAFENNVNSQNPKIDTSSLPTLDTPESLPFDSHRCMWCRKDGHICGEEFVTSTELNSHIIHTHIETRSNTCEWTGCEREKVPFHQRQKLVRHLQVHAKTMNHKCKVCNKAMSCDDQLKVHIRKHTQDRPFKCEACGKTFRSRNSLNVHHRTHTGLKPLVCTFPGCGKRFAESSNLAKHRRIHMPPEFECVQCKRKFTRKDHLHRHMRTKNHYGGSEPPEILKKPQIKLNKIQDNSGAGSQFSQLAPVKQGLGQSLMSVSNSQPHNNSPPDFPISPVQSNKDTPLGDPNGSMGTGQSYYSYQMPV